MWRGFYGLLRCALFFFFQAEDGIRDLVRSRGLGDVYKRQDLTYLSSSLVRTAARFGGNLDGLIHPAVAKALATRFGR